MLMDWFYVVLALLAFGMLTDGFRWFLWLLAFPCGRNEKRSFCSSLALFRDRYYLLYHAPTTDDDLSHFHHATLRPLPMSTYLCTTVCLQLSSVPIYIINPNSTTRDMNMTASALSDPSVVIDIREILNRRLILRDCLQ